MARLFFYSQHGKTHGPISAQQLRKMAGEGRLAETDWVRAADESKWYVAATVKGLSHGASDDTSPHAAGSLGTAPRRGSMDTDAGDSSEQPLTKCQHRSLKVFLASVRKPALIGATGALGLVALLFLTSRVSEQQETPGSTSAGAQTGQPEDREANASEEGGPACSCEILRDEVVADAPLRTHIEIDLLVRKCPSKDQILEMLGSKYNEAAARKCFKSRTHANWISVTAYSSLDHYHGRNSRYSLARLFITPAFDQPQVSFDEVVYKQMSALGEVRHALTEEERMQIFKEYWAADSRAYKKAEKRHPTEPIPLLTPGDSFELTSSMGLMPTTDAEQWFANGAPSIQLPAGTRVVIMDSSKNESGTQWTKVAAYLPGEHAGYRGWLVSLALGYQHPILADEVKFREQLDLQDACARDLKRLYLAEVLARHGITLEIAEAIFYEGSEKHWPD